MPNHDSSIPLAARSGVPLPMMIHTADTTRQNPAPSTARPEARTFTTQANPTSAFSLQPSDFGSNRLAISNPADLRFGVAPKPLTTRRGLKIGGGLVYPELNFTLPPMFVNESTMPDVRAQYQQIITGALHRAVELETPGLVVEFETLPPVNRNPPLKMNVGVLSTSSSRAAAVMRSMRSAYSPSAKAWRRP